MNEIKTDYLDAKQLADRLTALELHSTSELARLEQERDEAREENKKFREALEWIAERYDDSKSMHQVAMDDYEMSCIARAALRKQDAK